MGPLHVCSHTIGILFFTRLIALYLWGDRGCLLLQHAFRPFQDTCRYTRSLAFIALHNCRTNRITNTASYPDYTVWTKWIYSLRHRVAGFLRWSLFPIFGFTAVIITSNIYWGTIEKEHVTTHNNRVTVGTDTTSSCQMPETCTHHLTCWMLPKMGCSRVEEKKWQTLTPFQFPCTIHMRLYFVKKSNGLTVKLDSSWNLFLFTWRWQVNK